MKTDCVCIINARKGSTRYADKHLVDINGKPLIRRAFERAKKSEVFDNILLSTNCPDCISEAKAAGVDYFERDEKLCRDISGLSTAFMDAVEKSVDIYGKLHRWGCMFQPTHFMVTVDYLKTAYELICSMPMNSIAQLAHDSKQWHNLSLGIPTNLASSDDQPFGMVECLSHEVPWFYDLRPGAAILEKKMLVYHNILDEVSVDIHNERDVERAQLLHKWAFPEECE